MFRTTLLLLTAAIALGLEADRALGVCGALRSDCLLSLACFACLAAFGCLLADEAGGEGVRFYKNVSGRLSGMDHRAQWGAATRFDRTIDSCDRHGGQ